MSTPSQGLLLSNHKLRGPPAGCPLDALASPHPGTHSPALSVGASLPAPQVTLPRVTWVPCPPRRVYQYKEPLYTSPWRSLETCSLRLLPPLPSDPRAEPPPGSLHPLRSDPTLLSPRAGAAPSTRAFQTSRAQVRPPCRAPRSSPANPSPQTRAAWRHALLRLAVTPRSGGPQRPIQPLAPAARAACACPSPTPMSCLGPQSPRLGRGCSRGCPRSAGGIQAEPGRP